MSFEQFDKGGNIQITGSFLVKNSRECYHQALPLSVLFSPNPSHLTFACCFAQVPGQSEKENTSFWTLHYLELWPQRQANSMYESIQNGWMSSKWKCRHGMLSSWKESLFVVENLEHVGIKWKIRFVSFSRSPIFFACFLQPTLDGIAISFDLRQGQGLDVLW